jgi:hypothetical protein
MIDKDEALAAEKSSITSLQNLKPGGGEGLIYSNDMKYLLTIEI